MNNGERDSEKAEKLKAERNRVSKEIGALMGRRKSPKRREETRNETNRRAHH
jgi:hypothetical protein